MKTLDIVTDSILIVTHLLKVVLKSHSSTHSLLYQICFEKTFAHLYLVNILLQSLIWLQEWTTLQISRGFELRCVNVDIDIQVCISWKNHKNRNSYHLNPILSTSVRILEDLIWWSWVERSKNVRCEWLSTYSMMMMKKVGLDEALFTSWHKCFYMTSNRRVCLKDLIDFKSWRWWWKMVMIIVAKSWRLW